MIQHTLTKEEVTHLGRDYDEEGLDSKQYLLLSHHQSFLMENRKKCNLVVDWDESFLWALSFLFFSFVYMCMFRQGFYHVAPASLEFIM